MNDDKQFHSQLVRNKTKQMGFNIVFVSVFILQTILIGRSMMIQQSWLNVVLPVLIFNIPIMLYPLVDTWEYKPWQTKPQKYERHYID